MDGVGAAGHGSKVRPLKRPGMSLERFVGHDAPMANRTYRVTEIVGTSAEGIDEAIRNGITRASQTLRHLDWFEVTEVRGQIDGGDVRHWQVGIKIGFRLEDA